MHETRTRRGSQGPREHGPREHVVLLDDMAMPIGRADKAEVHTLDTPLHLAFSCYLFDESGRVLLTRRALAKRTWPGVWTNSFCGHPAPDESILDAVHRRAAQELGAEIRDVRPIAPDFRYRAVDASGIVENEVCPVYSAVLTGPLAPHTDEVMEFSWAEPGAVARAAQLAPFGFSPWMVLQLEELGWASQTPADVALAGAETP